MPLYLKLAVSNVRRSARDYSVYFATLGFAACLLYSFVGARPGAAVFCAPLAGAFIHDLFGLVLVALINAITT